MNSLLEEIKTLKKQLAQRRPEKSDRVTAEDLFSRAAQVGPVTVIIEALENATPDEMRQLIDVLRRKTEKNLAVLLVTTVDEKVQLAAGLTRDLIDQGLHAGNWLKEVAPIVGGGGGGRPDLAQAGGKTPEAIPAALEHAARTIRARLEPS